jgi:hypothetical protein
MIGESPIIGYPAASTRASSGLEADTIVPVVKSRHTAELIENAELRVFPDYGHRNVMTEIAPALLDLVYRTEKE